ncbi:MAG TPA: hypothetical protein VF783_26085, partial [Terriglobales bacterium]
MGSKEHNSSYDPVVIRAFCRLDRMVPGRQLNIGQASTALPQAQKPAPTMSKGLRPKISRPDSL